MYCSKILMEWAPNIHLLGMLTMDLYNCLSEKGVVSDLYLYLVKRSVAGFSAWWIPYLYIWTVLWGVTMLLPQYMPKKVAVPVYMLVCGLHGLAFGTLYAPAQALMFGLSLKGTIAWIVAGLPWDAVHALGNLAAGTLIVPLSSLLNKIEKASGRL